MFSVLLIFRHHLKSRIVLPLTFTGNNTVIIIVSHFDPPSPHISYLMLPFHSRYIYMFHRVLRNCYTPAWHLKSALWENWGQPLLTDGSNVLLTVCFCLATFSYGHETNQLVRLKILSELKLKYILVPKTKYWIVSFPWSLTYLIYS